MRELRRELCELQCVGEPELLELRGCGERVAGGDVCEGKLHFEYNRRPWSGCLSL